MRKHSSFRLSLGLFWLVLMPALLFAAPGERLTVTVQPTEAMLGPGEGLHLGLRVLSPEGEPLDSKDIKVTWRVVGKVGSVDPVGNFTAGQQPGRGLVRAIVKAGNAQGVGHALIKVGDVVLLDRMQRVAVTILPNDVHIPPGGSQQFQVEPTGEVTWRVIPPRLGTISPVGLFVAGKESGRGILLANVRTETGIGTARANIYLGDVQRAFHGTRQDLNVMPKHARVQPGGSVTFTAEVMGMRGEAAPGLYAWDVTPSYLGKITPTADGKGLFVAGKTAGRALVTTGFRTALQVGMGWAMVDIGSMPGGGPMRMSTPARAHVIPEDVTLDIGETVFFQVEAEGRDVQPTWSVMPRQLGRIDANGVFTPLTPGWGLVVASFQDRGGLSVGQARVFIGTAGNQPLRVLLTPTILEVAPEDGSVPLDVQVLDSRGELVPNARLIWQLLPGHLGRISSQGVFTPQRSGNGLITVSARTDTGVGTAQMRVVVGGHGSVMPRLVIRVTGPNRLVKSTPAEFTIQASSMHQAAIDLKGAQISWRTVPSRIGTLVSNGERATFTPTQSGRGVILVEVTSPQGSGTGRISITVE